MKSSEKPFRCGKLLTGHNHVIQDTEPTTTTALPHAVILFLLALSGFNERKQEPWTRDNQCGCLLFQAIENN